MGHQTEKLEFLKLQNSNGHFLTCLIENYLIMAHQNRDVSTKLTIKAQCLADVLSLTKKRYWSIGINFNLTFSLTAVQSFFGSSAFRNFFSKKFFFIREGLNEKQTKIRMKKKKKGRVKILIYAAASIFRFFILSLSPSLSFSLSHTHTHSLSIWLFYSSPAAKSDENETCVGWLSGSVKKWGRRSRGVGPPPPPPHKQPPPPPPLSPPPSSSFPSPIFPFHMIV